MVTLFFDNFVSAPLQSPITQKLLDGNEKFFLPFEAYEIFCFQVSWLVFDKIWSQ